MTKTEKQKVVTKLAKTLQSVTPAQREFMERKTIQHRIFYTTPAKCWCSHCGKAFSVQSIHDEETCPFCGQKAKTRKSRANSFYDFRYTAILATRGDWQVFRYFIIEANVQREGYNGGKWGLTYAPTYEITEVMRKWYNPTEKVSATESVQLRAFPNWRKIPYATWTELKYCTANQERSEWREEWFLKNAYPYGRILPYYTKRGMTLKNAGELDIDAYARQVEKRPYAETLLKYGYVDLANSCLYNNYKWTEYEQQIRIAIRHGVNFAKVKLSDYWDYLNLLEYYKMDIHNPQYIAPANFQAEHDRLVAMREAERQAQERERRRLAEIREKEREAEKQKLCEKRKAMWGSFIIKAYGMVFIPLISATDYENEGEAMHHCVAGYVNKKDSLILSARMNGERVETIEVSLTSFKVVQSRAVCNGTSKHHDEILEAMHKNMSRIRKIAKSA